MLDAASEVVWESRERSTGASEDELIELLVREVGEAREARPGVTAVGLGIPATIDHDRGIAVSAVNLPIENLPIRDLAEADRPAGLRRQRRQRGGARRASLRRGAGSRQRGDADDRHRDRRRPDPRRRDLPRRHRRRGRAGPYGDPDGRPACQGNCPGHGCVETFASGTALGREGREAAAQKPDSALGEMLAKGHGRRQGGHRGGPRRGTPPRSASSTWSAHGSGSRWPAWPTSSSRT